MFTGVFDSNFQGVCAEYGISDGLILASPLITDYGPELWGQALSQLSRERTPSVVMSVGTDKGERSTCSGKRSDHERLRGELYRGPARRRLGNYADTVGRFATRRRSSQYRTALPVVCPPRD
ncbi:MAG: hypothetical protein Ct9H300mP26_0580 [Acidimicrobiales bacterium]|nr:MAG: hypothetical protein Ct9H300mP26_0580 [Acidimicrobiales bacterium]